MSKWHTMSVLIIEVDNSDRNNETNGHAADTGGVRRPINVAARFSRKLCTAYTYAAHHHIAH